MAAAAEVYTEKDKKNYVKESDKYLTGLIDAGDFTKIHETLENYTNVGAAELRRKLNSTESFPSFVFLKRSIKHAIERNYIDVIRDMIEHHVATCQEDHHKETATLSRRSLEHCPFYFIMKQALRKGKKDIFDLMTTYISISHLIVPSKNSMQQRMFSALAVYMEMSRSRDLNLYHALMTFVNRKDAVTSVGPKVIATTGRSIMQYGSDSDSDSDSDSMTSEDDTNDEVIPFTLPPVTAVFPEDNVSQAYQLDPIVASGLTVKESLDIMQMYNLDMPKYCERLKNLYHYVALMSEEKMADFLTNYYTDVGKVFSHFRDKMRKRCYMKRDSEVKKIYGVDGRLTFIFEMRDIKGTLLMKAIERRNIGLVKLLLSMGVRFTKSFINEFGEVFILPNYFCHWTLRQSHEKKKSKTL